METLKDVVPIVYTVGSILSAMIIFFFVWIIRLLLMQNKAEKESIIKDAEIDKRVAVLEAKLQTYEDRIVGIEKKIDNFSLDLGEFRGYLKEDNANIARLRDDSRRLENSMQKIIDKIDKLWERK